jgi:transcriptional/translational regulatory protein YebC/TACO1
MESLELELIDAGAEDIEIDEDVITVTCAKDDFGSVNRKLEELEIEPDEAMLKRAEGDKNSRCGIGPQSNEAYRGA